MHASYLRNTCAWLCCVVVTGAAHVSAEQGKDGGRRSLAGVARTFEENRGQVDKAVRFLSRGSGYRAFLTDEELVFAFAGGESLRLRFLDAAPGGFTGIGLQPGRVNYLTARDPSRWTAGVPTYERVRRTNLYAGIDAVFYSNDGRLEYDLEAAPHASPNAIAFAIEGADRARVDERGDLVLGLEGGELRLPRPTVVQYSGNQKTVVGVDYVLNDRVVSIAVGRYDRSLPLVVDPEFVYSSYFGATDFDIATELAFDAAGNRYFVGTTKSLDFPTLNAAQPDRVGGAYDAFVVKLDPTGSQVLYATLLGGSQLDWGACLAIDADGAAYLTGHTQSDDFPLVNPLSSTYDGLQAGFVAKLDPSGGSFAFSTYFGSGVVFDVAVDGQKNIFVAGVGRFPALNAVFGGTAFLAKLHPSGKAIWYSTGLGGGDVSAAYGVALDAGANPVVAGFTFAANFPVVNALQTVFGGDADAFVARYTATRQVSPLLADGFDGENGGAATTAYAGFFNFQVSQGTVDLVSGNGGLSVAGQAGLSSALESTATLSLSSEPLIFMENYYRTLYRLDVGLAGSPGTGSGDVTIRLGSVFSETFTVAASAGPVSISREILVVNPASARLSIEWAASTAPPLVTDVSVAKLSERPAVDFSTFLGGSGSEGIRDVAVDADGRIVVAGATTSSDFPTVNPAQPANGGGLDGFVSRLSPSGSTLLLSSYFGGIRDDDALAVAVDGTGNAIIAGTTLSPDLLLVLPIQGYSPGNTDGFVAQFGAGGALAFSTYVGGTGYDAVNGVTVDAGGLIHITGQTDSRDLLAINALQAANAGGNDAFLAAISLDATAPSVACDAPDGAWHSEDAIIECAASDAGSGLVDPADASFTLMTIVPTGAETNVASTNSRTVCDRSGNCATAGPVGPNFVDKRGPTITVGAPVATTYTLGSAILASYSCADGGSGILTCSGPVPSGAAISTAAVGHHTFAVTSTDVVSNSASAAVGYDIAYGACLDYDPARAYSAGSTLPIKLRLCDASGANVSNPSVTLAATGVFMVSTSAPGALDDPGNANPDFNFRHTGDTGPNAGYIFNLSLKGFARGTYGLTFVATGDPTVHTVQFQVK